MEMEEQLAVCWLCNKYVIITWVLISKFTFITFHTKYNYFAFGVLFKYVFNNNNNKIGKSRLKFSNIMRTVCKSMWIHTLSHCSITFNIFLLKLYLRCLSLASVLSASKSLIILFHKRLSIFWTSWKENGIAHCLSSSYCSTDRTSLSFGLSILTM